MTLDLFGLRKKKKKKGDVGSCKVSHVEKPLLNNRSTTYMNRNINVIVVAGVYVNGMKAGTRPVDDLQPLTLLHCQVDQDRPVRQVGKRLDQRERRREVSTSRSLTSSLTHLTTRP